MNLFRNPLAVARNHGSSGSGVEHWWAQRFSAILLVPLTLWLVWSLFVLVTAEHAAAVQWISAPWNATLAVLLIIMTFWHARLGLQVVIEDYVHHRPLEISLRLLVSSAALLGALVSIIAVLTVVFGG